MKFIAGNNKSSRKDRLYLLVRGKQAVEHYDRRRPERIRIDGIGDICCRYWPDSDGLDVRAYLIDAMDPLRLVPVFP
ncbi:MAG: hypothetical protein K6G45_05545 [Lachnospiraceae bacterium]|nr:hypothetical protein [Lachnospiraceae bacterium]